MNDTLEVTTPTEREIRVTREFDAPRDLVFDCHTRPELVSRWMLGPPGWTMPVCDIDLRVGGEYRYVWRGDDEGSEFGFRGRFTEIAAPSRVVHTERMDGPAGDHGGDAMCTMTLEERDGRTTMIYSMVFPTAEVRDQALESGMADGMGAGYDRLAEILRERK